MPLQSEFLISSTTAAVLLPPQSALPLCPLPACFVPGSKKTAVISSKTAVKTTVVIIHFFLMGIVLLLIGALVGVAVTDSMNVFYNFILMPGLGMLKNPQKYSDNVSACTLCLSCDNVCPSKVGPGSQIYVWRQSLEKLGKADPVKKAMSNGMKYLFDRPALYTTALKFAPLVNLVPECCTHFSNWNAWGIGHAKPEFAKKSFHQLWKEGKVK